MTILFFARRFYPEIGGVEKHVLEIGKRLVKKGHRVAVITELEKNTNGLDYHLDSRSARLTGKIGGIEIYRINAGKDDWFKKFRIWKELWRLRKIVLNADVIHCHDVFFWYLPFKILYFTKNVYTTFHGYEGNFIPKEKAIIMHKIAEVLSKGNICVGDFLKKWYGTKPTFVIYGAVDFKKNVTEEFNSTLAKINRVIFLGRLEEETGILEYLKALSILKQRGTNLALDVYGDGSLKAESINYSKEHGLSVNFKGFVGNASEMIKDYEYVFCSRYLGILEAMICSKPVFAQYNNDIKEDYLKMAPFAPFISISRDEKEIAASLKNVISGKSKLNTDGAYGWVKDKTWENLVNVYLKLWSIS